MEPQVGWDSQSEMWLGLRGERILRMCSEWQSALETGAVFGYVFYLAVDQWWNGNG
jgi:hypothetical protein